MTSARTNLGPLTTEFRQPESCTVAIPPCNSTCIIAWGAQTCSDNPANTQGVQDNVDCWPERNNSSLPTKDALGGWGFYSPGLSCPIGYATSCSATGSVDGTFTFQFSLQQDETAVGCCPSNYGCQWHPGGPQGQTCFSIVKTGSITTARCSTGNTLDIGVMDIPATITQTASGTGTEFIISEFTVYAPLIQLNFKSTDLSSSTEADSSAKSSGNIISSPIDPSSHASLSTGAKVGIGVGAGVIVFVILGVALFLFNKRKTPKYTTVEQTQEEYRKAELQGREIQLTRVELDSPVRRNELQ